MNNPETLSALGTRHRGKTNCICFRMKRLVVISSKDINFIKKSTDLVININIVNIK